MGHRAGDEERSGEKQRGRDDQGERLEHAAASAARVGTGCPTVRESAQFGIMAPPSWRMENGGDKRSGTST
ncbi:hypothetical protein GCM10011428_79010 [Streptomyces violaceus]